MKKESINLPIVIQRGTSHAKILLSLLFAALLLVMAVWYLYPNAWRYRNLLQISPEIVLVLMGVVLVPEHGIQNYYLYRWLQAPVSLGESLALGFANSFANQLPLAGGMVTKGIYLKRRYQLSYTRFLGATVGLFILATSASGAIGIVSLLYVTASQSIMPPWPLTLSFAGMIALAFMPWLPLPLRSPRARWRKRLKQLQMGKELLNFPRPLVSRLYALHLLTVIKLAVRFWLAFRLMSQEVPLSYCLLFAAAAMLTQIVSIAPGGLGVQEVLVTATAHLMGIDIGITLIAVGIDRIVATLVIVLTGLLCSVWLGKNLVSTIPQGHIAAVSQSQSGES